MAYDIADKAALLTKLLSKPTGNYKSPAAPIPQTREVERNGDSLTVMVPESVMEEAAASVLEAEGLNPDEWEVTRFRRSEWGEGKVATRYEFKRTSRSQSTNKLSDAELIELSNRVPSPSIVPVGTTTALIALGDMQFGKEIDSPSADTLVRLFQILEQARDQIVANRDTYSQVVVAWLGDHLEGLESQGGANAWRTPLPLTEQIRLVRRVMIHAMKVLAEIGLPLTMVAVPGNHGDAKRFGKGLTTYDDNHDTEALLAVADAAKLSDAYSDVSFYVPETDELSVSLELSNTHVVFTHGHMARDPKKLMDWVKGQAFNRSSVYASCDLVVTGHFHHFYVETSTDRTLVIAPALEAQSTWYRHSAGVGGSPGALLLDIRGGMVQQVVHLRG